MTRRTPLPHPFVQLPFAVDQALAASISKGRLRVGDLGRPHHGIRTPLAPEPRTDLERLVSRCAEYAPLLRPGQLFSHVTAARLFGCPLPPGQAISQPPGQSISQPPGQAISQPPGHSTPGRRPAAGPVGEQPLHITAVSPERSPRRPGVVGHQSAAPHANSVLRYGLPTTSAARTWVSLAATLRLDDLVAIGDHLVLDPYLFDPRDPRPYTTIEQLHLELAGFHGRGSRAATSALQLIRQGAESRPESLLRLVLARAGLPEPELNLNLADAGGRWLARCDLVFSTYNTVVEYDGDHHRSTTAQYDKDVTRIEDLTFAGFHVVRVRSQGLFVSPANTIERVKRALRAGGWAG